MVSLVTGSSWCFLIVVFVKSYCNIGCHYWLVFACVCDIYTNSIYLFYLILSHCSFEKYFCCFSSLIIFHSDMEICPFIVLSLNEPKLNFNIIIHFSLSHRTTSIALSFTFKFYKESKKLANIYKCLTYTIFFYYFKCHI